MKITIKTLKQERLSVDAEPSETVLALKEKIQTQYSHEVSWQKLIFAGRILEDDKTIESYNISESDFLVLMVRKPKGAAAAPAPAPAASTSTPSTPAATPAAAPAATPAATTTPVAEPAPATPATPATPAPATETPAPAADAPATAAAGADSGLVTGGAYESTVQAIVDMGFDRNDVMRAMRASFNNPDRAVEYLTTGIPDMGEGPAPGGDSPFLAADDDGDDGGDEPGTPDMAAAAESGNLFQMAEAAAREQASAAQGSGPFDFLRQFPQFNQLRQFVQQNPQHLSAVLTSLASSNPQIWQLISQNQEEFMRLLREPVPEGTPPLNLGAGAPGAAGAAGGAGGGGHQIVITAEEREAIERLQALGFDRNAVIEAYLACDKNEALAANYLLNNAYGDD